MEPIQSREHATTRSGALARATMAMVLIVGATAALAITSLSQTDEQATTQSREVQLQVSQSQVSQSRVLQSQVLQSELPAPTVPVSGEVGPFAFGFLVCDWDPAGPGGVPGFDSWPPGSRR